MLIGFLGFLRDVMEGGMLVLVRLSSSILGFFWLPFGATILIIGVLGIAWLTLPCNVLAQPICEEILSLTTYRLLFGQVLRQDILAILFIVPIVVTLGGFLWTVMGAQLLRHGLRKHLPHAPVFGLALGILTVCLLIIIGLSLERGIRPWLTQQTERLGTQATPVETNLIAGYGQAINTAQAVGAAIALITGILSLGLLRPISDIQTSPAKGHQCEMCGLDNRTQRPRCILCHTPLMLEIKQVEAKSFTPNQSVSFPLILTQGEMGVGELSTGGLPVRSPQVKLYIPRGFSVETVKNTAIAQWRIESKREGGQMEITLAGPDYLTRVDQLTVTLKAAQSFQRQLLPQRTYQFLFSAVTSHGVTAQERIKVTVKRPPTIGERTLTRIGGALQNGIGRLGEGSRTLLRRIRGLQLPSTVTVRDKFSGLWSKVKSLASSVSQFVFSQWRSRRGGL